MVTSSTTTGGFCYSDVSSSNPTIQTLNQIQASGFESNPSEIFNLSSGMEMIGFSKNLEQQQEGGSTHNSVVWKGFFIKPSHDGGETVGASSSKTMNESTASDYYHHQLSKQDFPTGISDTSTTHHDQNLIIGNHQQQASWSDQQRLLVDDSSLRCVFPCEGNERPSQGLSLSLSSNNPSGIGLQSFELRHSTTPTTTSGHNHDQNLLEEMRFLNPNSSRAANLQYQLRHSSYLAPAQELLSEFCSLGTKQSEINKSKQSMKPKQWEDENGSSSSSKKNHSLYSLEFIELQKRKAKLISMLEELDRRYRHYCDQMKTVVSSFESVAGNGAATVYSTLASKAMSRHFRCLRDGIVCQIQATRKAMGEKDPVAPGTTKGETPRLRILDQALRQQRAFQQISMMENHPWRPQRGLPERSVSVLRAWLFEHFLHPYPSDVDKHVLARQTGLSRGQVSNWFINARVRLWKPMVEEMYLEELKEHENMASSDGVSNDLDDASGPNLQNIPSSADQKPTADQLVRIDSECLSSIITTANNPDKNDGFKGNKAFRNHHQMQHQHQNNQNFGSYMELDFSSYNHQTGGGVSYGNDHTSGQQNFNGGGGVSLTLGLQQHGESGVSLAFSSASQSSLFYSRDQIEDCQQVQYSLLDGEGQNLPYRNLMGAQLLHDLAGRGC